MYLTKRTSATIFLRPLLALLMTFLTVAAAPAAKVCTPVSIVGDATYCISGIVCGADAGKACPAKGAVALNDCHSGLKSYVSGKTGCVAPTDSTCEWLANDSGKGGVFVKPKPAPSHSLLPLW
ncbi:Aste57867_11764 [Aphanomyces stellatus]|uniref:Aste57867_11764 protein n=1 Tax=Aphanomyces stellatus TaxID=120398 RepID=A0A485KUD9_9STRA|nr:hypothetical protein As57867_011719 [Aphanomyces stellatus]VFT88620.1 Aste57867_11764 [Aphanomyces stellatus]